MKDKLITTAIGVACWAVATIVSLGINGGLPQDPTVKESLTVQPIAQDDCDTCGCGGLHDDGVLELKAGRLITVWIDPAGTMSDLSPAKTKELLLEGFEEFDSVCGLEFESVENKNGTRLRIEFVPDLGVLGRAWSNGRIQLNSTRDLGRVETRRVLQALACHESGHVLGLVHGGDRNDIMHPHLGYHWSVDEIKTLQRKHGKPEANDKPFHPTDRVEKGNQLRAAVALFQSADASWKRKVAQRNNFANLGRWEDVRRVQVDVLKQLKLRDERGQTVARLHGEWWQINKKWNTSSIEGVVKLGL